jgi:cyclophilin family peptidyl-prolyl cis-trans isomerase
VIELVDSFGNVSWSFSHISLQGRAPGSYLVRAWISYPPQAVDGLVTIYHHLPVPSDAQEPDNMLSQAKPLAKVEGYPGIRGVAGTLQPGDVDWSSFTLVQRPSIGSQVWFYGPPGERFTVELFSSSGALISFQFADLDAPDGKVLGLPTTLNPGNYFLRVSGKANTFAPPAQFTTGDYTLAVLSDALEAVDPYEPNDSFATARQLASPESPPQSPTLDGTSIIDTVSLPAGDMDWFSFTTTGAADYRHVIEVFDESDTAEFIVVLYDDAGTLVALPDSFFGGDSWESISLAGLPAATYRLGIMNLNGLSVPNYLISFDLPGVSSAQSDALEAYARGNNTREEVDAQAAGNARSSNLGALSGTQVRDSLSITSGDEDWFRFSWSGTAEQQHGVFIYFDHEQGDLDLELLDAAGMSLETSAGHRNSEYLYLKGRPAGIYFVRVVGHNGAVNSRYRLQLNLPGADRLESNNSRTEFTDLNNGTSQPKSQTISDLSLHSSSDEDWFKITPAAVGGLPGEHVIIEFEHASGNLAMELYADNDTTPRAVSDGVGNSEFLSWGSQDTTGVTSWYVRVRGSANPRYRLIFTGPERYTGDRMEGTGGNNTRATATALHQQPEARASSSSIVLGDLSGSSALSIHRSGTVFDEDWFLLRLQEAPKRGDYAELLLDHTKGDLDLELHTLTSTIPVRIAEGAGSVHRIPLNGLPPSSYPADFYLRVRGTGQTTSPGYVLTVQAPRVPFTSTAGTGDALEVNETATAASQLGGVNGFLQREALSIHSSEDEDWFSFTLAAQGRVNDVVSIAFSHAYGDLDMALYSASDPTTPIDVSGGTTNGEYVSLQGRAAGNYLVKVYGYDGATNRDYSLSIIGPETGGMDWADTQASNQTAVTATNLRQVKGVQTWRSFSLHSGTDEDWFRITTIAVAGPEHYIQLVSDSKDGDIDLEVYDSAGTQLRGSSRTAENVETVRFRNLTGMITPGAAGTYLVKVTGYRGATQPAYQLIISTPDRTTQGDWAEPNDTSVTTNRLGLIEGSQTVGGLSLHTATDQDHFTFTTSRAIPAGIRDYNIVVLFDDSVASNVALNASLTYGSGTAVGGIERSQNRLFIPLAGLPQATDAQPFRLQITGTAPIPAYTLLITTPRPAEADWAEQRANEIYLGSGGNGTRQRSTDLRSIEEGVAVGSLSSFQTSGGDEDWFRFVLPRAPLAGQSAYIDFLKYEGDLQLTLFDNSGTQLATALSEAGGNRKRIVFPTTATFPATWHLRVSGGPNPEYRLVIQGNPAARDDRLENNGTAALAVDLREANLSPSSGRKDPDPPGIFWSNAGQQNSNQSVTPLSGSFNYGGTPLTGVPYNPASATAYNSVTPIPEYLQSSNLIGGGLNLPSFAQPYRQLDQGIFDTAALVGSQLQNDLPQPNFNFSNQSVQSQYQPYSSYQQPSYPMPWQFPQQSYYNSQPLFNFNPMQSFGGSLNQFFGGTLGGFIGGLLPQYGATPFMGFGFPNYPPSSSSDPFASMQLNPIPQLPKWGRSAGTRSPTVVLENLSITAGDHDWFRLNLSKDGEGGDFVAIRFNHTLGGLMLELYEQFDPATVTTEAEMENYLVERADTQGNGEQISLRQLRRGVYLVRVRGSASITTNASYLLAVAAPQPPPEGGDWAETNDTPDTARDLRTVDGGALVSGLSIHTATDVDWFRFTLPDVGRARDKVQMLFPHRQGDLDLELFTAINSTSPLCFSRSTSDTEEISLSGCPAGEYLLKVSGHAGALSPAYALQLRTPETNLILPDALEANNSTTSATQIEASESVKTISNLTIHSQQSGTADVDVFRFEIPVGVTGTTAHFIRLAPVEDYAPLRMDLYKEGVVGVQRSLANTTDGGENALSLSALTSGTYFLHVQAVTSGQPSRYDLFLNLPNTANNRATGQAEWTVMVYMTASTLERFAFEDINEMEAALARYPSSVNFTVLWDQSAGTGRRQYATAGTSAWGTTGKSVLRPDLDMERVNSLFVDTSTEQNTGAAATLTSFINWSVANAPAKRYALVMWDHGSGDLDGFNQDNADNAPPDAMFTDEMAAALAALPSGTRSALRLIAFDACSMAMAEVVHALRDHADLIIASQETEGGSGYDYLTAFDELAARPDTVTLEEVSAGIVASYQAQYQGSPFFQDTHSATSVSRLTASGTGLVAALRSFCDAALNPSLPPGDWTSMINARTRAASFFEKPEYRDLGQFLTHVGTTAANTTLRNAALNARAALQNAVISKTADQRAMEGLTVYFPAVGAVRTDYISRNSSYLAATRWGEFLNAFLSQATGPVGQIADWAENNDLSSRARDLHELSSAGQVIDSLSLHHAGDVDWFRFTNRAAGPATMRIERVSGAGHLRLELFSNPRAAVAAATASTSGTGYSASLSSTFSASTEYWLKVTPAISGGATNAPYRLLLDLPVASTSGDWASGNDSSGKAHDLGALVSRQLYTGLTVGSTGDFFSFETPRNKSISTTSGTVRISNPTRSFITLRLYRADNGELEQQTTESGATVQLPIPSDNGTHYRLEIRRASGSGEVPYTLSIDPAAATGVFARFHVRIGTGPVRTFTCRLHEDKVPMTVANFISLAEGSRPWLDPQTGRVMTNTSYYNGSTIHRISPGFVFQGGSRMGGGIDGPGWVIPDEFHPILRHDRAGILSMANYGSNTAGGQFFVTLSSAHWLDDRYSAFGEVTEGMETVGDIGAVAITPQEQPLTPVVIDQIEIIRVGEVARAFPEMSVLGGDVEISNGDASPTDTDLTFFGSLPVMNANNARTYTIRNTGNAALNFTGTPKIGLSGPAADDFKILNQLPTQLAAGDSLQFTIAFNPKAPGTRRALVSIPNDDPDEAPYTFAVSGGGTQPTLTRQSIVFNPPATVYYPAQGNVVLQAHATSGNPVSFSLVSGPASLTGNLLTLTGIGTVKVQATQPASAGYVAAPPVVRTIAVKSNPTTLTLMNLNQTYSGTPRPIFTLGGGSAAITYKVGTTYVSTAPIAAGSYPVKAVAGGKTVTGTLVVAKAPLFVTPDSKHKFAGKANPALTFQHSGFVNGESAGTAVSSAPTLSTTATLTSPGGFYPITAKGGTSANYTFIYQTGTLVVESFAGSYEALLRDTTPLPVGKVGITVTTAGTSFTGKLDTVADTAPVSLVSSALDTDINTETASGSVTVTKNGISYSLGITLNLEGGFSATLTRAAGAFGSAQDGFKLATGNVTYAGAHTAVLEPATPASATVPAGAGYAVMTINASGMINVAGRSGDGVPLVGSLAPDIRSNPGYRLFIQPYRTGSPLRTNSFLAGVFQLSTHPTLAPRRYLTEASLSWKKTANSADESYRAGFGPVSTVMMIDPWLPPATATPLFTRLGLTRGNFAVSLSSAGSAQDSMLPTRLAVSTANAITVSSPVTSPMNPLKWTGTFTPATGLYIGSFILTDGLTKRLVPFNTILRQPASSSDPLIGNGHFLLPGLTGTEKVAGEVIFTRP